MSGLFFKNTSLGSAAWVAALALALPLSQASAQEAVGAAGRAKISMNPDVSVVIDGNYYRSSGDEPAGHLVNEALGFGHAHGGEAHEHGHAHGLQEGFNLRHLELMLAADVDPYFKGWTIVAVGEDGAELEEAVFQTTRLPAGLQLKGGKFFSDFSRHNAQHPHEWNFADQPLIHRLLLGDHGLNEKGLQLSWLAPTPFYLTLGVEALQGENEQLFAYAADEDNPLPERVGPRLFVGWAKLAPALTGANAVQFGVFAARGVHQEAHLGPAGEEDPGSHWLSGHQWLAGADFVYRYTPNTSYGDGWLTLEGGYLYREKDIELVAHNDPARAGLIGNSLTGTQDGFYLQGAYGFAPRWRFGLRGEMAGLTNDIGEPNGETESFDSSYRASAMVDWTLSEFSRLRLQVNRGRYATEEGNKDATEVFLQAVLAFGAHGAHKF